MIRLASQFSGLSCTMSASLPSANMLLIYAVSSCPFCCRCCIRSCLLVGIGYRFINSGDLFVDLVLVGHYRGVPLCRYQDVVAKVCIQAHVEVPDLFLVWSVL